MVLLLSKINKLTLLAWTHSWNASTHGSRSTASTAAAWQ